MTSKIINQIDPYTGFTRIEIYDGDISSNKYSYFSEDIPDIVLNNNFFNIGLEDKIINKSNISFNS